MKKLFALFLLAALSLLLQQPLYADAADSVDGYRPQVPIQQVNDSGQALVVDRDRSRVSLWDMESSTADWSRSVESIVQTDVLNPDKFIILSRSGNSLEKRVLNQHGETIGSSSYPIRLSEQTSAVRWLMPYNQVPERIMTLEDKVFKVYQAPWDKPVIQSDFTSYLKDPGEYISEISYSKYPYVALKVSLDEIGASTHNKLVIVNLYKKSAVTIDHFDTSFSIKTTNTTTIVHTSHDNGPHAANVDWPDLSKPQAVLQVYSSATGRLIHDVKQQFTDHDGGGWETSLSGDVMLLKNKDTSVWSLYRTNGMEIAKAVPAPYAASYELAGYQANAQSVFLLVQKPESTTSIYQRVVIESAVE
ncbi:hypothetical protein DNH61_10410 [Paenibacillus sambharensis]|uniref:Uncharacterized protein n=1 Tax=Paenibacillus sambharensis TaxID=1803190 RepID=A0A2W1LN30_9BACL|nr:hypothetical protein [Paenibacillus sambharensis]PZD95854.1 hypothetical protein DNH61_10410 [Paenibacillus sambharensis]